MFFLSPESESCAYLYGSFGVAKLLTQVLLIENICEEPWMNLITTCQQRNINLKFTLTAHLKNDFNNML